MHLGNFLFQGATGDSHSQWITLVGSILFVSHALGARIRVAVMAVNAMVNLVHYPAVAEARIS